jgi:hypothetical protein
VIPVGPVHEGPAPTKGSGKHCVITVGINVPIPPGHPHAPPRDFSRGILRLKRDLARVKFTGGFVFWDQQYPTDSPSHHEVPFAFKPFAFCEARSMGYKLVLWLDATMQIKRSIEPLFDFIEHDGYLIFRENHTVGEYCKDDALAPLKITREDSFRLLSCWACAVGLNLNDPRSIEFLRQWLERATDGITFPGPKWSGVRGWPATASQDPRVKGHRHDQTAASVIALKLGMNNWKSNQVFDTFLKNDRAFVRQ